ncbi:MAG: hypothetical protein WC579_02890, partial [Candidatus Paceibacterota bacterium]
TAVDGILRAEALRMTTFSLVILSAACPPNRRAKDPSAFSNIVLTSFLLNVKYFITFSHS